MASSWRPCQSDWPLTANFEPASFTMWPRSCASVEGVMQLPDGCQQEARRLVAWNEVLNPGLCLLYPKS